MSDYKAVMLACQVMDRINKRSGRTCGAKTRAGAPCQMRPVPWGKRCHLHGGFSTGPTTPECVYLNAFETGSEARCGIGRWIKYYNGDRPHSRHNGLTPNEAYETSWKGEKLAA